mgnify:CR=1 FL=1
MSEFQTFIHKKIRASAALYPLAALLTFIGAAVAAYAILQIGAIPKILLVFALMFPMIGVWLIYKWIQSLNLAKHPIAKLLFEHPQDLQKITIENNVMNYRVTFKPNTGHWHFITLWKEADLTTLEQYVRQNISHEVIIERVALHIR